MDCSEFGREFQRRTDLKKKDFAYLAKVGLGRSTSKTSELHVHFCLSKMKKRIQGEEADNSEAAGKTQPYRGKTLPFSNQALVIRILQKEQTWAYASPRIGHDL